MSYILQTNHLCKMINGKELVSDVNIHVKQGEIYGFLGPNGAGKTTVMKMLTNLWKPRTGTIELFGKPLEASSYEVLKRMGSIIEFPTFYEHMSGKENLKLHCEYMGYYNKGSVEEALELLNLTQAADKPAGSYSLGMKQRLGIARAILCKPELILLDEPTNGLDPAGMKQIRDLFRMLSAEYGMTLMISSHLLSEIESIADTIGVLNHGRMVKEISMKEIAQTNTTYIEIAVEDTKKAAYVLGGHHRAEERLLPQPHALCERLQLDASGRRRDHGVQQPDSHELGRDGGSGNDLFRAQPQCGQKFRHRVRNVHGGVV